MRLVTQCFAVIALVCVVGCAGPVPRDSSAVQTAPAAASAVAAQRPVQQTETLSPSFMRGNYHAKVNEYPTILTISEVGPHEISGEVFSGGRTGQFEASLVDGAFGIVFPNGNRYTEMRTCADGHSSICGRFQSGRTGMWSDVKFTRR